MMTTQGFAIMVIVAAAIAFIVEFFIGDNEELEDDLDPDSIDFDDMARQAPRDPECEDDL